MISGLVSMRLHGLTIRWSDFVVQAFRQAWLPTSTMNLTIVFNPKAPIVGQIDQHHWQPLWGTGSDFDGCSPTDIWCTWGTQSRKAEPLGKARSQMEIIWIQISFHIISPPTDLPDVSDQIPSRFQADSSSICRNCFASADWPGIFWPSSWWPSMPWSCPSSWHGPNASERMAPWTTSTRPWKKWKNMGRLRTCLIIFIHKELKNIEMDGT